MKEAHDKGQTFNFLLDKVREIERKRKLNVYDTKGADSLFKVDGKFEFVFGHAD